MAFSFFSRARISSKYASSSTGRFVLPYSSSSSSVLLASEFDPPSSSVEDASLGETSSSSSSISATTAPTSFMLYLSIRRRNAASSGDSSTGIIGDFVSVSRFPTSLSGRRFDGLFSSRDVGLLEG